MKLRIILIVLSLLTFLSASTGGYLYYASSKKAAFREADRQAVLYAETIKNHLSSFLSEYLKSVKALAGLDELQQALSRQEDESLAKANAILDHFSDAMVVDVCYLMDHEGNTIASSNRDAPDSFVGKNYSFRPYYQEAMHGRPAIYMASGITSGKRGVYYSYPVYGGARDIPLGVAVIKASIYLVEQDFKREFEGIVVLTDPHGIVFISSRKDWLYNFLWKPSPESISKIAVTRQFGEGPWRWTGLGMKDGTHAIDLSGNEYLISRTNIDNYPGWDVIYLQSVQAISKKVSLPFIKITGFVILAICVLIGLLVSFLYKKASFQIAQRKAAEEALRESEETAIALLNAPTEGALLLDTKGTILALNKPAADALGKSEKDIIGACAFDLFSPDIAAARKAHHDKVVRLCRPVRYEDKSGGRCLDTNVYPIFDGQGKVVRVAIFSHDITDQKRAEEELKHAKEELTHYSKDLERRVRKRTREITSILKYTPAVVFIKDKQCSYIMINPRYEELFSVSNEEIRGKTDYDVFPKKTADQFRASDLQVLTEGRSFQVEEVIPQQGSMHTYLSVKFPLYDEKRSVRGLCGIATDITALKKAQDQLRRLSGSIMASQEKERTAIARELHDELGQMLTALRIDSVWMREFLKEISPKAADRALTMCSLIDKSIDEVRGMAIRLRPGVLDDLGLIAALEWYSTDFEKRTGIACRFKHVNVPQIDEILATAAYRTVQEALTNVARHSSATHVDVFLQTQDGILTLMVADNGCGFYTGKLSDFDSLGIAGMRERATLVGGSMKIQSKPERGTAVYFMAPLRRESEAVH